MRISIPKERRVENALVLDAQGIANRVGYVNALLESHADFGTLEADDEENPSLANQLVILSHMTCIVATASHLSVRVEELEQAARWIKITDDPTTWPPLDFEVWGLGADGKQHTFKRIGNAPGWNRDYADFGPKFAERVTHWRYLPAAPDEQGSGE